MKRLRNLSLHISASTLKSPKLHQGHQLPPCPAIRVVCHSNWASSPKMPAFPSPRALSLFFRDTGRARRGLQTTPCSTTGEKTDLLLHGEKKKAPTNEVIGE